MKYLLPVLTTNHANPSICGPCGGKCCKRYPGIPAPEDFGAPDREAMKWNILGALLTGRWAVDWWDGDPRPVEEREGKSFFRSEFLRPATQGDEGRVFHAGWGGPCTFHTETGCSLGEKRPHQCRAGIPSETGICYGDVGKPGYVLAWIPYRDILNEIGKMVEEAT